MYRRIYGSILLLILGVAAITLIKPLNLTAETAVQTTGAAGQTSQATVQSTQTADGTTQPGAQATQAAAGTTQPEAQTAKTTSQTAQIGNQTTGSQAEADKAKTTQPAAAAAASKAAAGSSAAVSSSKPLSQIFKDKGINPGKADISILVDKSDHVLSILANGSVMKSYHVELGDNGLGDKKISGDHKTPEGTFYISEKSVLDPPDEYLGTRWMRLSYPNVEDAQRGLRQGLISKSIYSRIVGAIEDLAIPPQATALGGGVGIHGGSTPALGKDWTWGCVGLTNKDVEDFYSFVKVGTKVVIRL